MRPAQSRKAHRCSRSSVRSHDTSLCDAWCMDRPRVVERGASSSPITSETEADDDPFVIRSCLYSRRTDENAAQRVWFDCTPHPYGDPALGGNGAGPTSALSRFRPDEFTIAMLATVMLGFLLPCRGTSAGIFGDLAAVAIGLLFFLQGARLSRAAIIAGALHWRLHLVIFAATLCCSQSSDSLCGRCLGPC